MDKQISFEQVQREFKRWRKRKKTGRGRIPQALWRKAVALAQEAGVATTAKTLGLQFDKLRKLTALTGKVVPETEPLETKAESAQPVEIAARWYKATPGQWKTLRPLTPNGKDGLAHCSVEIGTPDGPEYMRVQIAWRGVTPDVARLVEAIQQQT